MLKYPVPGLHWTRKEIKNIRCKFEYSGKKKLLFLGWEIQIHRAISLSILRLFLQNFQGEYLKWI